MTANIIDKLVSFVSPEAGLRRARARAMSAIIDMNVRAYDANSKSRRTSGWTASATSANAEIQQAHVNVRNRMRELIRNDSYAKKAIRTLVGNVVGAGIRPKPDALSANQSKALKKAWKDWGETKNCDFENRMNFYGLEKLLMRTISESGSAIVLKRRYQNDSGIPIQIQILEPDFLDSNMTNSGLAGGGYVLGGIEFDKNGKRVAYWLFDHHPGDSFVIGKNLMSRRVPASDVLHVFHVERAGQSDGMPLGVTAMLKLRDFNDYEDAQLVKQKIAACFSVFITSTADGILAGGTQGEKQRQIAEKVEPGIIEILPPGKEVTFAMPPTTEGYADYTKTVLRSVAAGWGITYEQLTNDLSNVNFSSGKMGWIESGKWFSELQDDVVKVQFCDEVWKWFVQGSILGGRIKEGTYDCSWTSPKREFIDPSKETEAAIASMRGGLKSFEDIALEAGRDPDELMAEIAKWTDIAKGLGLELEFDPRYENKLNATDSRKF